MIYELLNVHDKVAVEKVLRLSWPNHRANQPQRASVRFVQRLLKPWASALRLKSNPGQVALAD
jgi:hypothetical protein